MARWAMWAAVIFLALPMAAVRAGEPDILTLARECFRHPGAAQALLADDAARVEGLSAEALQSLGARALARLLALQCIRYRLAADGGLWLETVSRGGEMPRGGPVWGERQDIIRTLLAALDSAVRGIEDEKERVAVARELLAVVESMSFRVSGSEHPTALRQLREKVVAVACAVTEREPSAPQLKPAPTAVGVASPATRTGLPAIIRHPISHQRLTPAEMDATYRMICSFLAERAADGTTRAKPGESQIVPTSQGQVLPSSSREEQASAPWFHRLCGMLAGLLLGFAAAALIFRHRRA